MNTVFVGDITITSTTHGVCITKKGESWGDPWPIADSSIEVRDVEGLIQALRLVQKQKSWDNW
jgi:hypothetical protein